MSANIAAIFGTRAIVPLGEILRESNVRARDGYMNLPVLSLTRHDGLVPQAMRFKNRVASEDVSPYKVVTQGQLVYSPIKIWERGIGVLKNGIAGLVSPLYAVWDVVGADPDFIDYLLRSDRLLTDYNRFAVGTGQRRQALSKRDFLNISVSLPALDNQRHIARILLTIQRAREARERVVRSLRGALEANRTALFDAAGPMVPLSEVVSDIRYGTSERCTVEGIGPHVMGIKNVGEVDLHELQGASRLPRHPKPDDKGWLRPGDLLFVRTNADPDRIGRCAIYEGVPESAMFASYLLRARVDDPDINPRFIAHYAASQAGRATLRAGGSGAADGKFNLNAPTLGSWFVPRPPLAQQLLAIERLDAFQRNLNAHEACLSRLDLVFRAAQTKLMEW